jgi:hypothetical protein
MQAKFVFAHQALLVFSDFEAFTYGAGLGCIL